MYYLQSQGMIKEGLFQGTYFEEKDAQQLGQKIA